ncbi:hypothetical protein R1flu_023119 [Riccia fluitans]|uniref:Malectin-like domain-containing protein n=1 Tax=Riccia fluitans TaxID=41844 RepID=A0ABD1XR96_9MARC
MPKFIYLFVLLILYLCLQAFVRSDAQLTEFRSIDCGAASSYEDAELGLKWETDDNYTKSGITRKMEGQDLPKQLYSYRYFTSRRNKHCYVLPVTTDTTYLLRVRLFPGSGGSSSIDLPVEFNATFNNNLFFSYSAVTDTDRVDVTYESLFHSFEREEIYLCLLPGSKGTPFINSVELRGLPDTSYFVTRNPGEVPQFMVLGDRLNMGPKPGGNSFFRYPDDDFDRFWQPAVPPRFPSFARIDESSFIENLTLFTYTPASGADDGYNWPPNRTVIDAWVGPQLAFTIPRSRVDTDKLYASFYIAEIRPEVNITEDFSYAVDDTSYSYSIGDRGAHTIWFNEVVLKDPKIIHVNVSSSSVDGVILNGFEYYHLYDFDISATYSIDEKALDGLQESFGLQDWQGDPCFPVAWDWLTCDTEASRIQKLKLSHMNLSGPIPENISNLVELTEIYLDNNSLEGSIPESLASLPKLQILALDDNKLTGEIPPGLQNRRGFTFTGNPGLIGAGSGATAQAPGSQPSPKSAAVRTIRETDILLLGMVLWASLFLQVSI